MRVSIICLLMTLFAGCTVIVEPEHGQLPSAQEPAVIVIDDNQHPAAGKSVVQGRAAQDNVVVNTIKELADSMFDRPGLITPQSNVAVGTFGSVRTLALDSSHSTALKQLAPQLQEGLKGELARKGIRVIEFRLRNSIALKDGQDVMLSRDLSQIQTDHDIDYFLTGTLTEQPTGIIINAQLVDVKTKQVVTAATKTLPQDYWNGKSRSTYSNKMIYRNAN